MPFPRPCLKLISPAPSDTQINFQTSPGSKEQGLRASIVAIATANFCQLQLLTMALQNLVARFIVSVIGRAAFGTPLESHSAAFGLH